MKIETPKLEIRFLGTGTSQGIPVIGCKCKACISPDFRDKRLRTSVLIGFNNRNVVIDVGPDFRQQMLREKVASLDAVLLTHEHNDHIIGADDLRPFIFRQHKNMEVYAENRVIQELKLRFAYAFKSNPYPGAPSFDIKEIKLDQKFSVFGLEIIPIRVMHADLPILGFRMGNFAYLTDVKTIPNEELEKLRGIQVLVLNALRKRSHHSHLSIDEAIQLSNELGSPKTYLTHFSHDLGPVNSWEKELPIHIRPAYDELRLEV